MSHKGKWEYFKAVYERYRRAGREQKQVILDEFCLNTGYHRKYAIRLLNGPIPEKVPRRPRHRRPLYSAQAVSILTAVWEAAGYPWSVKLKALLPLWMPWIRRRFRLSERLERQLLRLSSRQMDRRLRGRKTQLRRRRYGRTKPGTLLKHHIPLQTDRWDKKIPGYTEVDLVSHSGNSASGEFAHSLNVTDLGTGWTESRALLGRSQEAVRQALEEIESVLPFRLRGIDSDTGSEFINWHLKAYCERKQIQFTRGRPYKKDDNAHVEQKNWTHVRKLLGWDRYDSPEAVEAINDLNRHPLRLWMNLYLPSVKLAKKVRVGSRLRRVYEPPQTPFQRVVASSQADLRKVAQLKALLKTLDPFELAKTVDRKLDRIYRLANGRLSPKAPKDFQSSKQPTGARLGPSLAHAAGMLILVGIQTILCVAQFRWITLP